jgi:hypothetical protein
MSQVPGLGHVTLTVILRYFTSSCPTSPAGYRIAYNMNHLKWGLKGREKMETLDLSSRTA